jgi:MFS family permease
MQYPRTGARVALALLAAINLLNFIDRYIIAAVEPSIRAAFFSPNEPNAMAITGILGTAFVVSYMIAAPALGWLADRFSRWAIVGWAVIIWSLASGASGLATGIGILLLTRIFVGIGEGGYGPAAPPIIADLFPMANRGRMLAIFFAAMPVGSALGYVLGGVINIQFGWRWAFYLLVPPGLVLGLLCLLYKDHRGPQATGKGRPLPSRGNYIGLLKTHSYIFNMIAQTAMAFSVGGLAFWIPAYFKFRGLPLSAVAVFGGINAVAGLVSTLAGGFIADRLRKRFGGSYFLISGIGMLFGFPLLITMLYIPFPLAWIPLFGALFFIYFNVGPSNAALANVSPPSVRASAFAFNIFVIHALGDAIAPPILGFVAGHTNMNVAFLAISAVMLVSGSVWLAGAKYLAADTAAVEAAAAVETGAITQAEDCPSS